MSYNRQPVAEDPMQIWGAVGVLLILLLFVIWLFLPEVVYASCLILHTLWGLVDWGPFHNYAAPRYNLLAMTGNNAANISYSQWVNVMEQTIGILWMYLLPVTLWCLWEWYQHPGQSRFTRRPVDITRLPHIFASLSPAIAPVNHVWREGYRYMKAGVMLADFTPSGIAQPGLFDEIQPRKNSEKLMKTLDELNQSGKGKVWFAGRGTAPEWQMKREMLSPAYTTRWTDLPVAQL